MDFTAAVLVGLVSAAIAALVSNVSQTVLTRQERLAKQLEQMAGIQKIERPEEKKSLVPPAQLLDEHEPTYSLRILATSGRAFLLQRMVFLSSLLAKGVHIQILLLNPESDVRLFNEYPELLLDIRSSLDILKKMMQSPEARSGRLSVRLSSQLSLETLIFIDDEYLIVSSNLPSKLPNHLFFLIKRGEKSIYSVYENAFQFQWERAILFDSIEVE